MNNLEEIIDFLNKFCFKKCGHGSNESCICKVAVRFKEIEKLQAQERIVEINDKKLKKF